LLSRSLRTIRTLDAAGKIPRGVRIGAGKMWSVAEITAWIEAGCPDREDWESK
jgi:hypothetical protein